MTNRFNSTRVVRANPKAFTLIELLLVLVILGILAAVIVPALAKRPDQAKKTKAVADISSIKTALEMFNIDNARYPTADEGLAILVENFNNISGWQGPYLEMKNDPWDNEYVFLNPGQYHTNSYDIISAGPDGILNTEDDIHN